MKGKFIVFEGIDGSGKSTQAKMLCDYFINKNIKSVLTFEPTNGVYGKKIRDSFSSERLSPIEEINLFTLDRKEHIKDFIIPNLEKGIHVISDRYYYSTAAYQSIRGFDIKNILKEQESFALKPDISFIISIDIKESIKRIGKRGKANSFEQESELVNVSEAYKNIVSSDIVFINADNMSVLELHNYILSIVKERI